jgi:peptide subunit release factor RF-3
MNSQHAARYALSEVAREKQMRDFTDITDPEDLSAELGAARFLAQESLQSGNIGLANMLLTTVAKLAQGQVQVKRMKSEYLERAVVMRLAIEIVRIVGEAVEGKFAGWETALSDAADRVGEAIAVATNKPRLESTNED